MIRIAIVEDQLDDFKHLENFIRRYGIESNTPIDIVRFSNGLNFLDEYTPNFDVVFMDVEMPHLDGIKTAKKLREMDDAVALVFVTGMIQYAINGYEVNAIDFMVKPVTYFNLSSKLEKALAFAEKNKERHLVLHKEGTSFLVQLKDIFYIEKEKNYVVFHTTKGEFKERTSLSQMEEELSAQGFLKCCSSFIINIIHVQEVRSDTILIHDQILPLARRQKKIFLLEFAQYFGGTR